ncbi:MAG: DDE-type integrase/transposase/recombinase [Gemmatimonadota bacterium]
MASIRRRDGCGIFRGLRGRETPGEAGDHNTDRYANNLAEVSHQPTRQRERQMRGFKSAGQAQRFLSVHGVIRNLFNLGRHHLSSANYRMLRERSFKDWNAATAG